LRNQSKLNENKKPSERQNFKKEERNRKKRIMLEIFFFIGIFKQKHIFTKKNVKTIF
jgi:hypothetical protein